MAEIAASRLIDHHDRKGFEDMSDAGVLGWVGALGAFVGGLATAGGLVYTAWQLHYSRIDQSDNEAWRRQEFARSLVDRLSSDEELAFCTRALDWGVGPLIIPQKYRVLFGQEKEEGGNADKTIIDHDPAIMANALKPHLDLGWKAPQALTYRYCFDAFFWYLEGIAYQVRVRNVSKEQLVGLDYYLDLVRKPPYFSWTRKDGWARHPFRPFIKKYYRDLEGFLWPPKP
jgi:hypothetical protein